MADDKVQRDKKRIKPAKRNDNDKDTLAHNEEKSPPKASDPHELSPPMSEREAKVVAEYRKTLGEGSSSLTNPHISFEHAMASKNIDGEALPGIDAGEWEKADVAAKPEMINQKLHQNKISVFQASHTNVVERTPAHPRKSSSQQKPKDPEPEKLDKAALLGQMVAKVVREYLKGRREDRVRLEIRLIDEDDKSLDLTAGTKVDTQRILKGKVKDERGGIVLKKTPKHHG